MRDQGQMGTSEGSFTQGTMGTMIERTKEHVVGRDWRPIRGGDMRNILSPEDICNYIRCAHALCKGWHF